MATLKTKTIQPSTVTNVNLGTTGDAVLLNSDSIQTNIYKDSGGNTLFQSDGAGTLSNVNSSFTGGGPQLILSQTASTSTNISFTANLDGTYDLYLFVFIDIHPADDSNWLGFNMSTDGGSSYAVTKTTTFFRAQNSEAGGGEGIAYQSGNDLAQSTAYQPISADLGNDADQVTNGYLYLYTPASTTFVKNFYSRFVCSHASQYCNDMYASGYGNTTSAVNAVDFKMNSGNIDSGKIKMYGIS